MPLRILRLRAGLVAAAAVVAVVPSLQARAAEPAAATGAATTAAATGATAGAAATGFGWPAGTGVSYDDGRAAGGRARLTWSDATGTGAVTAPAASSALEVRAAGDQCAGAPELAVAVDGQALGTVPVPSGDWTPLRFPGAFAAGTHTVALTFPNDYLGGGCDRNLHLDTVAFVAAPAPQGDPLAGVAFYVDPNSDAARAAAAARASDPAGAALFAKIAGVPEAEFVGDWVPTSQVQSFVAGRVAAAGDTLPTYVLYAIPHRDCGSYSAGGLGSPAAYHDWVSGVAAGLGSHRAAVVLEPDALAQLDCLSAGDQSARLAMLRDAVGLLAAHPAAAVYIDAGNSTWQPVSVMAGRLQSAGVASARGFSLNVANFNPTGGELAYGDALSAALGGRHFVVDTSRNGLGPAPTWCNPAGQALGTRPTTATGDARADALLWLKRVGESDGTCNGGPPAGTWWPDYARGLAGRAAW